VHRKAAVAATALIMLAAALAWTAGPGSAHEGHDHGNPATPEASPEMNTGTGSVYLTITNGGDAPDRLLSASTDAALTIEMHALAVTNDVMAMTPLQDGLVIPAGETVVLAPQVMHLMLVNLTRDLRPGDTYDLVLTFERAGEVSVTVTVGAGAPEATLAVTAGDLSIEGVWSLPAPMLTSGTGVPEATPAHAR